MRSRLRSHRILLDLSHSIHVSVCVGGHPESPSRDRMLLSFLSKVAQDKLQDSGREPGVQDCSADVAPPGTTNPLILDCLHRTT